MKSRKIYPCKIVDIQSFSSQLHEIVTDYLLILAKVACLWNASPKIFQLRAATLVICELWATIQPVCELRALS